MLKHSRGQSITEYVVLIGIVSMALIGMQVYMKRGIQGLIKGAASELGSQEDAEIDPTKGVKTKSSSAMYNTNSGKPKDATDIPDLAVGQTQRVRVFKEGSQQIDSYTVGTTTGTSTYITEREE